MANTGRKETMVVPIPVITADDTSFTDSKMSCSSASPRMLSRSSRASRCLTTFSMNTTPTSTITPMAIAIPLRATMLASTPVSFMMMNVLSTAKGNMTDITIEALRLTTRISTTMIQMSTS